VQLLAGPVATRIAGSLLSGRSAQELRSIEGRYQAQLVQDKARQIELYRNYTNQHEILLVPFRVISWIVLDGTFGWGESRAFQTRTLETAASFFEDAAVALIIKNFGHPASLQQRQSEQFYGAFLETQK